MDGGRLVTYYKRTTRNELISGDNVHLPTGEVLTPDNADTWPGPVDGWAWYDTADEAYAALFPGLPLAELAALPARVAAAQTVLAEAAQLAAPTMTADVLDLLARAADALEKG